MAPKKYSKPKKKSRSGAPAAVHVHEVLEELCGAQAQLVAQAEAGLKEDETRESMYRSIMSLVQKLGTVGSKNMTELIQAANNGPWTAEEKKAFASAIRDHGAAAGQTDIATARKKTQACTKLENFCSQEFFIGIRDPTASRMSRANKIGLIFFATIIS